MWFYILIFLLSAILLFLFKKRAFGILFTFFLCVIGLRNGVGTDWDNYIIFYDQISSVSNWSYLLFFSDPIYSFINFFSYKVDLGIYFVNLVCSFVFLFGLFAFCKRQKNPSIGFLVALPYLVFVVAMGYTRQSAALGCVFLALNSLTDKKTVLFFVYIFVAVGFHISALVGFLFLCSNFKIKHFFKFSGAIFFLIFVFIFLLLFDAVKAKIDFYIASELDSQGSMIRLGLNSFAAMVFFVFKKRFKSALGAKYDIVNFLSLASVFLFLFSFYFPTIADRIGLYFSLVQIYVFSNISVLINLKGRFKYFIFIVFFYFVFLLTWLFTSYYANNFWIPYGNFLF